MSERYPKIRIRTQGGSLQVREGLSFTFYLRHPHDVIAAGVRRSLEAYLRAIGPQALGRYADEEGEYQPLDSEGWERIRREMHQPEWAIIRLYDVVPGDIRYRFEYYGRQLVDLFGEPDSEEVCRLIFWLPSEFLEEHGPSRVRELALELAAPLPFCSGYAGLAFNAQLDLLGIAEEVAKRCMRYPGMDISVPQWRLGTRLWGVQWLTFLGQPVLGELGGAAGLRSKLHEPGTTVQEMEGERALVTLGKWPEAGDTEQGHPLPAYRELARVLEPWLFQESRDIHFPPELERRWVRRFLD
jgi:hypothetical protein